MRAVSKYEGNISVKKKKQTGILSILIVSSCHSTTEVKIWLNFKAYKKEFWIRLVKIGLHAFFRVQKISRIDKNSHQNFLNNSKNKNTQILISNLIFKPCIKQKIECMFLCSF